jgi:DNA-binding response OmpR family regulator
MKVLLAEDTKDLNHAVAKMLELSGYTVDSAYDGIEAEEKLNANGYDAVILDIMMPRKDGLEVLKDMRSHHDVTPVLMLTAKAEVEDRVSGLDTGADDYLTKPFSMKELTARVNALTRRRTKYAKENMSYGDITLKSETQELSSENTVRLSLREMEFLQLLLDHTDRDLDTEFLLERVWADSPEAGSDTVWLYINYLKGKLQYINSSLQIRGEKDGSFRLEEGDE